MIVDLEHEMKAKVKILKYAKQYVVAQKARLMKTYQTAEKEAVEEDKQLKNIRQYLGIEKDRHEKIEQHRNKM